MKTAVKKAIITAAGLGSRLFPYTKHINKLMLPIINKPVIQYLVDELADSGIEEIIISGRYLEPIKSYFKHNSKLITMASKFGHENSLKNLKIADKKCKITFLEQKHPKGWMYEVYLARKKLNRGPFAVVFSDNLFYSKIPATRQLIHKFKKTHLCIRSFGRFILTPDVFEILEKQDFTLGDDAGVVSDVFEELEIRKKVLSLHIKGKIFDVGDPLDYLKSITFFAMQNKDLKKEFKKYLKTEILK